MSAPLFRTSLFAVLLLVLAATGFAANARSAPRLRLRCTVSPRTLPPAGGAIAVHVDAGQQTVEALLVTLTRPDHTADTQAMTTLGDGQFEATFVLPRNTGRAALKYSLKAFGRGADATGATANCGSVRVKGTADASPFGISACRITPRKLPATGGSVHVEAQITGKHKGLQLQAVVEDQPVLQVALTAGKGGVYRGDLNLPANAGSTQANYNLYVVAQVVGGDEPVKQDCGFVAVAPADASAQIHGIAVAGAANGVPEVRTFRADTLDPIDSFLPFGRLFQGTSTVAAGDLDGDGVPDLISGAGPGGAPEVRVTRGRDSQEIGSFLAYDAAFTGGVFVAAGDVNGDGVPDIITGAGTGSTAGHVKVFDGRTDAVLSSFLAYDVGFTGGVRVAAGDVNGDGYADIITGTGASATGHVKVFSGSDGSLLRSFLPFDPAFTGGIYVAAGDVNGDGRADVVVGAGAGGGPHVKVFSGQNGGLLYDFFAYDAAFTGGVTVATGDLDGDGRADIVTGAGPGSAGGHVKVFDGATGAIVHSFFAYDPGFSGGVRVGAW